MMSYNLPDTDIDEMLMPTCGEVGDRFILQTQPEEHRWKWNFETLEVDKVIPKVLLIGESVAAGYFYRPLLTFGSMLQDLMPDYQVIDLSRIDFPIGEFHRFQIYVDTLKPEKIIIFIGNNSLPLRNLENLSAWFIQEMCWLSSHKKNVTFILPGFDHLNWHPLEIKTLCIEDRKFLQSIREKRDLSNDEVTYLKLMNHQGCPTYNFLLGRFYFDQNEKKIAAKYFQQSSNTYLGLEDLSPGITPLVREGLKSACHTLSFNIIDAEVVLKEDLNNCYMDYCHYNSSALFKLASSVTSVDSTYVPDFPIEIRARKLAFYHCYSFGRFSYAISHLKVLKQLLSCNDFHLFLDEVEGIIFSGSNPWFTKNFIEHGYGDSFKMIFFYPDLNFYYFLRDENPSYKLTILKVESRVNLLEKKRCYHSWRHLHAKVFQENFLQYHCYDTIFTSHFLRDEVPSGNLALDLYLELIGDLLHSPGPVNVSINGRVIGTIPVERICSARLVIDSQNISSYNSLSIEFHLRQQAVSGKSLWKIHLLKIRSAD